ncbi:ABC transporter substrate-binding protein [Lachnoclostridium sp.]|uniref:ABC transporter substrate-binding protein n=1 Tax=Lachnoclostridium sp. TaxID=2028282 RepID=UPI002898692F|nr:ABC transporter substrate-binding protein [Lachnoclostridium sp.]
MRFKKLVAMGICTCLAVTLLAGCGKKNEDQVNNNVTATPSEGPSTPSDGDSGKDEMPENVNAVGVYPIVKEPITLTIMGRKDPGGTDWGELEVFKRLTKITNINFEFELSEGDTFVEQKNIALVGGEYPDLILRADTSSITDEETYGPQGVFLDLTDLIDKYAPNIKALLQERPDIKAAITSMDGKIYGLPYAFQTATTQGHTGFFDSKWMDNVGITKVPETTDELYDMLVKFKEMDANGNGDPNDEIPFSCSGLNTTIRRLLIPAFTGTAEGLGFDIKNGEVVYAPALPEYKEFLIYANKLYSEGLLDPEFSTQTSQQWQAKVKAGMCGVYSASPTLLDPEVTVTQQLSLPPLTSSTNDKKVVIQPDNLYPARGFITDKCKDPVAAIRLLDMFYATPENAVEGFSGQTLFLGWEGEHWEYTNGMKDFYQWINPITGFGDINKSISVNMELPGYLNFTAGPAGNPLMEMKVEQVNSMQKPYYKTAYPINARFTAEESERGNVIENDLYTYVTMMTTKFIIGEVSVDKFDEYIDTLNKTGLPELLEIKRAALARWNEAMK